jgi:hypothetical protein
LVYKGILRGCTKQALYGALRYSLEARIKIKYFIVVPERILNEFL